MKTKNRTLSERIFSDAYGSDMRERDLDSESKSEIIFLTYAKIFVIACLIGMGAVLILKLIIY